MAKSVIALKRQRDEIQRDLEKAEEKEALRIGRIAIRSGLAEIEIPDTDLREAFDTLAARFQSTNGANLARKRAKSQEAASQSHGEPVAQG